MSSYLHRVFLVFFFDLQARFQAILKEFAPNPLSFKKKRQGRKPPSADRHDPRSIWPQFCPLIDSHRFLTPHGHG